MSRVSSDFGNASIFAGSYGWASAGRFHHAKSQLNVFGLVGGFTDQTGTYSNAAGHVILPHVLGSKPLRAVHSRVGIVLRSTLTCS